MKKFFVINLILINFIFGVGGMSVSTAAEQYSKTAEYFGSFVKLTVCYESNQEATLQTALSEIWNRFDDIHWRLSVYHPQSDLNKINHSYPDAAVVGADTYNLIKNSRDYHQLSKGVFDITIYPLIKVWQQAVKDKVLPTEAQIALAKKSVGIDKYELLAGNQVRLKAPGVSLTIDSIADGYAGDQAAEILRKYGFNNFLLDVTGELYAGGVSCDLEPWQIGVRDPFDYENIVETLVLKDSSVTTSGNVERFYEINGKKFSHIINPKTGYPSKSVISATVIAPTTEYSDFLSTAFCLLDVKESMEIIDALGEGYASMILVYENAQNVRQYNSKNYKQYLDVSRQD